MAFKMKGAPMHDLSSKHGTNANYKKSGAPGLLGKILDPLGLKNKLMGGNKSNCPPQQQQQVIGGPKPVEPVTPEEAVPTQMREGLMTRGTDPSPRKLKKPKRVDPKKPKRVDPRTDPRYAYKLNKAKKKEGAPKKTDPKDKSVSEKQTIIDKKNIEASSNQPIEGMTTGDYKDTVKSVKRQNRIDTRNISRREIQKELKSRKRQGVNKSEKLDVGLLGRVFGGKKKLASQLSHQKNVSDI